jgi:N-acetylneuraminic acid mutarotase
MRSIFRLLCVSLLSVSISSIGSGAIAQQATSPTTPITSTLPSSEPSTSDAATTITSLPSLPRELTSFGGAQVSDTWYVYGGHDGPAHHYCNDQQSPTLYAWKIGSSDGWQAIGEGPRLQGLAMVATDDNLFRLGGFEARNDAQQPQDMWSTSLVARFELASKQWKPVPSLPEPRSSFDATVLDGSIYVIGGWMLHGATNEGTFHETAWRLSLADVNAGWKSIAKPTFQRRALAVVAHRGKVYAIGGMDASGNPSTRVDTYDPQADQWHEGPSLVGEPMAGFGAAALVVADRLLVTTSEGTTQTLADDGSSWQVTSHYEPGRFFHRMYQHGDGAAMVGGANMEIGRIIESAMVPIAEKH